VGLNLGSEVAPAQPVAPGVLHSEPGPLAATLGAAASKGNANRRASTATIFRAISVPPSCDLPTVCVLEAEISTGWISLSIDDRLVGGALDGSGHRLQRPIPANAPAGSGLPASGGPVTRCPSPSRTTGPAW